MPHPDPSDPANTKPIEVGETWENPVTKERAVIVEAPWWNDDGRLVAELTALPGARVVGEHLHPKQRETFTAVSGELTVLRDGKKTTLREGKTATIKPGVWHDWWNEGDTDAIVRMEVEPGERFMHMIETLFGLAREGYVDDKGTPEPLQLALIAREFSDVFVLRRPPRVVQQVLFRILARSARKRGYRATYPSLSRTVNGPRSKLADANVG